MMVRLIIVVLALAAAITGCGERETVKFNHADITGASYAQDFALTDHTGQKRTLADFRSKVVLVFFGYTHCPDVCPTTLAEMKLVLGKLGQDAARVQVLFVTLDPARDTQAVLARYVPSFDPGFLGMYADEKTTADVARDFKVFYQKVPGSTPGSYTLDHTAGSYVFDPQGRLRLFVRHGGDPELLVADLRQLLKAG